MNTYYPAPEDDIDDMPALPAGEMPDVDQLPTTEPSGPPAGSAPPFPSTVANVAAAADAGVPIRA